MPRALVTGATGMLGAHIVDRLLTDGWTVRALVRDSARASWLEAQGASLHTADVLDVESFTAAARGCDVVFHAAAAITPPAGSWEAYRRPNVDGTQNAISAARATGARLLHVSSVAVYGTNARYGDGRNGDVPTYSGTTEDIPLAPLHERLWYARSKRESEAMVLAAHQRGEIWSTAIRPSVIYGNRDRQFVPRVAKLLRLGVLPLPGGGHSTLAIVHAANVADAALLAAGSDVAGGRAYNVANDFEISVARFMQLGAQGLGRRLRIVSVPRIVARAGIAVARSALRVAGAGGVAAMLDGTIDFVLRDNPFDSSRARRELGWNPRVTPDIGVPEAFRWTADHGSG